MNAKMHASVVAVVLAWNLEILVLPQRPALVRIAQADGEIITLHSYEVRIRIKGRVSTARVQARDAAHAKDLVRAQYGPDVEILGTKRLD